MDYLQRKGDDLWLHVHIQPGVKNTAWSGVYGDRIKIRLAAPPVDGRANAALCDWLAKELILVGRDISIVRGESSRQKVICLSSAASRYDEICERIMRLLDLC